MTTSAHLKTLREACGLTLNEAADLAGVSLRSWQYWESPDYEGGIKPDVLNALNGYLIILDEAAGNFDTAIESLPEGTPVTLTRYRTEEALLRNHPDWVGGLSLHNAVVRYLLTLYADLDVTVVWDDDPRAVIGQDWC